MSQIGERVLGRKGSGPFWYAGTVRHIDGNRSYVIFDDGDDALVEASKLKKLELNEGDRVRTARRGTRGSLPQTSSLPGRGLAPTRHRSPGGASVATSTTRALARREAS